MGFLDDASEWLDDVLDEVDAVTVTLRRGDRETTGVSAGRGRSDGLLLQSDGTATSQETRDYFIGFDAYKFDGLRTEPRPGDRIVEATADGALVFEVRPFNGEDAARPVDVRRKKWRCHVQLVDEQLENVLGNEHGQMLTTEDGTPIAAEGQDE